MPVLCASSLLAPAGCSALPAHFWMELLPALALQGAPPRPQNRRSGSASPGRVTPFGYPARFLSFSGHDWKRTPGHSSRTSVPCSAGGRSTLSAACNIRNTRPVPAGLKNCGAAPPVRSLLPVNTADSLSGCPQCFVYGRLFQQQFLAFLPLPQGQGSFRPMPLHFSCSS